MERREVEGAQEVNSDLPKEVIVEQREVEHGFGA